MALVSFLARPKPKIPFPGLSLIQNQTETLVTHGAVFIELDFLSVSQYSKWTKIEKKTDLANIWPHVWSITYHKLASFFPFFAFSLRLTCCRCLAKNAKKKKKKKKENEWKKNDTEKTIYSEEKKKKLLTDPDGEERKESQNKRSNLVIFLYYFYRIFLFRIPVSHVMYLSLTFLVKNFPLSFSIVLFFVFARSINCCFN